MRQFKHTKKPLHWLVKASVWLKNLKSSSSSDVKLKLIRDFTGVEKHLKRIL